MFVCFLFVWRGDFFLFWYRISKTNNHLHKIYDYLFRDEVFFIYVFLFCLFIGVNFTSLTSYDIIIKQKFRKGWTEIAFYFIFLFFVSFILFYCFENHGRQEPARSTYESIAQDNFYYDFFLHLGIYLKLKSSR